MLTHDAIQEFEQLINEEVEIAVNENIDVIPGDTLVTFVVPQDDIDKTCLQFTTIQILLGSVKSASNFILADHHYQLVGLQTIIRCVAPDLYPLSPMYLNKDGLDRLIMVGLSIDLMLNATDLSAPHAGSVDYMEARLANYFTDARDIAY